MMMTIEYQTPLMQEMGRDFDFVTVEGSESELFAYLRGFLVDVHIKSVKVL
jgi:hypothetical protein